jgi:predicted small secreted protein
MRKAVLIMSVLLIVGLLVTGCNKETTEDQTQPVGENIQVTNNPDVYIDNEIIDENSTIEIGEMI